MTMTSNDFFSILYRIDDLDDGSFYIGATTSESRWRSGYLGSGVKQRQHIKEHPPIERDPVNSNAHRYKRTIIKDDFTTEEELHKAEVEEIRCYCAFVEGKWIVDDPKCNNTRTSKQGEGAPCSECGNAYGHLSTCSKVRFCSECGGRIGHHLKSCSRFTERIGCPECGSTGNHKKDCSRFSPTVCEECGGRGGKHKKKCSRYKRSRPCPECGYPAGHHAQTCSLHKDMKICSECGGKNGKHKKQCSHYTPRKPCSECGAFGGHHQGDCSKRRKRKETVCEECGSRSSYFHKQGCSKQKKEPCPECGSMGWTHKSSCSKYVVPKGSCKHCGTPPGGKHKKDCPEFVPVICPECGGRSNRHKKSCSKRKK